MFTTLSENKKMSSIFLTIFLIAIIISIILDIEICWIFFIATFVSIYDLINYFIKIYKVKLKIKGFWFDIITDVFLIIFFLNKILNCKFN